MQLNPIVSPTVKELFVKEIETLILSGKAEIGEHLPTEREMADQMRVSRTTVNAGLAELEKKGFIEIAPRKGTIVSDFMRHGNLDTLLAIINFNGGRFDFEVFRSLMEFRRSIECEGAYLAALNRTQKDIDYIESVCKEIEHDASVEDMAGLAFLYHHAILCATQNYIYPLIFNAFKDICIVFSCNAFNRIGTWKAKEYTHEILEAIRQQDAELAKDLMNKLISTRMDDLERKYPTFGGTL